MDVRGWQKCSEHQKFFFFVSIQFEAFLIEIKNEELQDEELQK